MNRSGESFTVTSFAGGLLLPGFGLRLSGWTCTRSPPGRAPGAGLPESCGVKAFTQEGGFHVVLATGTIIGGVEQSDWFSLAAEAFLLFQEHIPALGSTGERKRRPAGSGRVASTDKSSTQ